MRISVNRFSGLLVPPGMGALADMDSVGGLANAFYIIGIAGVIALGLLSV